MCRGRSPESSPGPVPKVLADAPTRMRCSRCCRLLLLMSVGGSLCCSTWWCTAGVEALMSAARSLLPPGPPASLLARMDSGVGDRGVGCRLKDGPALLPHVICPALLQLKSGLPTVAPATALSAPRVHRGPADLKLLHLLTIPGVPAALGMPLPAIPDTGKRMWLVVRPTAGSMTEVSRLMVAMRSDAASFSWKSAWTLRILAMRLSRSRGCSTPAAMSWDSWSTGQGRGRRHWGQSGMDDEKPGKRVSRCT